ncbi:MAG: hypothetical protein RL385_6006, partial [Pseudomonadota bacterium]
MNQLSACRSRKLSLPAVAVAALLTADSSSGAAQDISRFQIAHPSGVGELFNGGVYTYLTNDDGSEFDPVMAENHVRRLAQSGMTHLYVRSAAPTTIIDTCHKYSCYVSNQAVKGYVDGSNLVFPPGGAQQIATQIQSLLQYPEYMSTSAMEEPPDNQAFIDSLYDYYAQINSAAGTSAPFYLLHNRVEAAAKSAAKTFKPVMTGYDRTYLFNW